MQPRSGRLVARVAAGVLGAVPLLAPALAAARPREGRPAASAKVDRKATAAAPVPLGPAFSVEPTEREISRARVFAEPLVPVGGPTQPEENARLAAALGAYLRREDPEDTTALVEFLESHPRSHWRASLLTNMGTLYRRAGRYSKALAAWEQAWSLSKDDESPLGRAVADRAVGELAALDAGLGRRGRLEALLQDVEPRDVRGAASERIAAARQGLWLMRHRPQDAFRCGSLALERILRHRWQASGSEPRWPDLRAARPTSVGASLFHLSSVARALGLRVQMAKRVPGSEVLVPAVVHWSAGPFAAVLEEANGRYLVHDPSFAEDTWTTARTLDEEASGYFLVPEGPLPRGWRPVEAGEGERIWYPEPSAFENVSACPGHPGSNQEGSSPC